MRYEYKYIVPESKLDLLRQMIMPFMDVDKFADAGGTNQYTVRSIYFDTPRYDYYFEKIEGIKNRKKLRIRGYNEEDKDKIIFLEIKRKYDIPILKFRAPVIYKDALEIFEEAKLNGHIINDERFPKGSESSKRFFFQMYANNLRPVVTVIYEREAYLCKFDDTIRITFDKNLRSVAYPAINELYSEKNARRSLLNSFILEVKFNNHFPGWLNPTISQLGLMKQSASKYCISLDACNIVQRISKSSLYTRSKWLTHDN